MTDPHRNALVGDRGDAGTGQPERPSRRLIGCLALLCVGAVGCAALNAYWNGLFRECLSTNQIFAGAQPVLVTLSAEYPVARQRVVVHYSAAANQPQTHTIGAGVLEGILSRVPVAGRDRVTSSGDMVQGGLRT